jgi:glucosamine--fructose-6-phosphate aminotransferase (isomerizing)
MCGIFAYCNYGTPTKQGVVVDKLLTGLRRLEYRGYDSAGIAIDSGPSRDQLTPLVIREVGKIDQLASLVEKKNLNPDMYLENHCGIGHTRWATHGPPAPRNSHPHTSDESNEFLVVHNGIITNHQPWEIFENSFLHIHNGGNWAQLNQTHLELSKLVEAFEQLFFLPSQPSF